MNQTYKSVAALRIGVFGKGGSGKSTVSVLLAEQLAAQGNQVVLLDADSTNRGLHRALGLTNCPKSLLDYFGGSVFSGGRVTCPVDDPQRLPGATIDMDTLSQDFFATTESGIMLMVAGKIGETGPGAGCDGPVSKIARDLVVRSGSETPLLIIDYKAGFEDSARGALTSIDWALIVVDPCMTALQAAIEMVHMVRRIQQGALPATKHLKDRQVADVMNELYTQASIRGTGVILNKVTNEATEIRMRKVLGKAGIYPLGSVRWDQAIADAWLEGSRVRHVQAETDISNILSEMVDGIQRTVCVPD